MPTPMLDMIKNPMHLKNLTPKVQSTFFFLLPLSCRIESSNLLSLSLYKTKSTQELKQLADDIRSELSFMMSQTQKSFKASLSVVELTVAIHHVFHAPVDKILWDIEDQVRTFFYING